MVKIITKLLTIIVFRIIINYTDRQLKSKSFKCKFSLNTGQVAFKFYHRERLLLRRRIGLETSKTTCVRNADFRVRKMRIIKAAYLKKP